MASSPGELVRFWVFIGAAVLAVFAASSDLYWTVEWWGTPSRSCGPGCVASANPWSQGVPAFAYIGACFALAGLFVYLAIRARRRRSTNR